ncbi:MAG: DUF1294 domain-containing protein [Lachnospiraceae bacterium]|nr:DUF1294 domain-containing protein [Lachnospiraceae bacterium]
MQYIAVYIIVINLVTCILYGIDKLKAMVGGRRTPEKVLLGFTFIGGSIGAFVGMQIFRHKTRHLKFQILVPVCLMLHIATVLFVYIKWFA